MEKYKDQATEVPWAFIGSRIWLPQVEPQNDTMTRELINYKRDAVLYSH